MHSVYLRSYVHTFAFWMCYVTKANQHHHHHRMRQSKSWRWETFLESRAQSSDSECYFQHINNTQAAQVTLALGLNKVSAVDRCATGIEQANRYTYLGCMICCCNVGLRMVAMVMVVVGCCCRGCCSSNNNNNNSRQNLDSCTRC